MDFFTRLRVNGPVYGILVVGARPIALLTQHPQNLFLPEAFGKSQGNARNVEAISFGSKVFTDQHGFRIPENMPASSKPSKRKVLFLLGDSVAFGPGLVENQTFSGMLRSRFPDLEVYNSSVIGYSTQDYAVNRT